MVLLYNMLFLREHQKIYAHLDYTLQAAQIIQYETIDADLSGLLTRAPRINRFVNAIHSLTKYLSYRKYNEPNFLRDIPKHELKQR